MRQYVVSDKIDEEKLRHQAERRRQALAKAGCSTYSLGRRAGEVSIVCLCCGLGSMHPDDIRNRYCGFCGEYHSEDREEETIP